MADAIVSFAVQRIGDFLIQKIVLLKNVRTNIEWLRTELGYMQSFMKDAEEKLGSDHRVQQWISDITDLAYDTVSVLEKFTLRIEDIGGGPKSGFVDRLRNCACICSKQPQLYNIGEEIESLRERLADISRRRETYGIKNIGDAGREGTSRGPISRSIIKDLKRSTSYADEEQVFVGFKDVTERLLGELLKDEPNRSIVSILGMGGLGKTTVARRLYQASQALNNFPYRAWVCVSQEYSIADLLRTIIKSFRKGSSEERKQLEEMKVEDLERELRTMLKDQRYLVVVDDLWHKEAWQSLKRAFPNSKNGSRVIITTRKKEVAERTDEKCFVHELRFLTPKESWNLFCKKLGYRGDYVDWCSDAMLDLGKQMVQKCRGLPLAIIVLGGLLSHKSKLEDWQKVREHLWEQMKDDTYEIDPLLTLSYKDLSSELKQCFLYLGMFPEDYLINAEKLMWLWMAEGFIPGKERMEDIAEDYLNELIDRCLIQVENKLWEKIFECRIHDLLRDLAVEKAMEVSFYDIYDPVKYSAPLSCRRHAIYTQIEKYLASSLSNPKMRSVLLFNPDNERPGIDKLSSACRTFKELWVLDLENVVLSVPDHGYAVLPSEITSLIHLRYLGLTNSTVVIFPKSIGNLKSLQTLEVFPFDGVSCSLPPEICNLTNLRHLSCRSKGDLNVACLSSLRTLQFVDYDQWGKIDTTNLINLRELAMARLRPLGEAYSLDSVSKLKSLRSLFLSCSYRSVFPSLGPLSSCRCLTRLWLKGKIEKASSLEMLPQSITELTLSASRLEEDPMPILGRLLNLRSLDLDGCYDGRKIVCRAEGFPQLKFLRLYGLDNLEIWELEDGALPVIRGLGVSADYTSTLIPERLKSVPVLPKLDIPWHSVRIPLSY